MMKKTVIVITSIGVLATEVIWQLYKGYRSSQGKAINTSNGCAKQLSRNKKPIHEVMFFSKDSSLCRTHLECMKPCAALNCPIRHLRTIINYLDSATDTLDVCLYFFTFPALAEAIIRAKNRNVVVRMILDESMAQNDTSQIMSFYNEGIKLISKKLDTLMHHKFVVIDNNILISGSINWTKSAFFGNFENMLITNESAIVKPFINEFERIWTMLNVNKTTEANSKNLNVQ